MAAASVLAGIGWSAPAGDCPAGGSAGWPGASPTVSLCTTGGSVVVVGGGGGGFVVVVSVVVGGGGGAWFVVVGEVDA